MFGQCPTAATALKSTQLNQQIPALLQGGGRRWVEPDQFGGIVHTPARQLQCQRRQIGLQDLRRTLGRQLGMLIDGPQAIADTRLGTAGAPGTLLGGSPGDAPGMQAGHARHRIESRLPAQAGVDHHPHPVDGQAGLGNGRGQHHLAPPRRGRADGRTLGGKVKIAVQRRHIHIRRIGQGGFQAGLQSPDLCGAREKHQQTAAVRGQRLQYQLLQHRLDGLPRGQRTAVVDLHRVLPAFTADQRRIVQQPADRRRIQRGRHDQEFQRVLLIAQVLLGLQTERQAQIGVQTAFMEFVEDHQADAGQLGVGQQQTLQYSLGHHFDAGGGADSGFQADAITDGLTHRLAEQLGQAFGCGPRRQPPRLQQNDLLSCQPVAVQQRQRHQSGLAGTGRRLQHHTGVRGQLLVQCRQHGLYGKLVHRGSLSIEAGHYTPPSSSHQCGRV